MNENNSLEEILDAIQDEDGNAYTEEEANDLSELIDKAKHFYPPNKSGEREINVLCNDIVRLQKQMRQHVALTQSLFFNDLLLTNSLKEQLKKQMNIMGELKDKVFYTYGELELKYS